MRQEHTIENLVKANPRADKAKIEAAIKILEQAGRSAPPAYTLSIPYSRPLVSGRRDAGGAVRDVRQAG